MRRLRINNKAMSKRLGSDCKAIALRFAATLERLRSDCKAIVQYFKVNCEMVVYHNMMQGNRKAI
jgi:hypothetical protein